MLEGRWEEAVVLQALRGSDGKCFRFDRYQLVPGLVVAVDLRALSCDDRRVAFYWILRLREFLVRIFSIEQRAGRLTNTLAVRSEEWWVNSIHDEEYRWIFMCSSGAILFGSQGI